jgi:hypothetical protein
VDKKNISVHTKWEVVYEDDFTISTWKYNSKVSRINPVEVLITYKTEPPETKKRKKKS